MASITIFINLVLIGLSHCYVFPDDNLELVDLENNEVLFEGDLILDKKTAANYRNAVPHDYQLWPNKTVIYTFDPNYSSTERFHLREAMQKISSNTCIRFKQRSTEKDYVFIRKASGCSSSGVGRRGGRQTVTLASYCFERPSTLTHEIMHALGLDHEHCRYDRDDYIHVYYENMRPGDRIRFQFQKQGKNWRLFRPFDFNSTMLYPNNAFAQPGKITMTPKDPRYKLPTDKSRPVLGQGDIHNLRMLYKC